MSTLWDPCCRTTALTPFPKILKHSWLRLLGLVSMLAILPMVMSAATHTDHQITGYEIWTASDNPHLVSGVVTVEKGARLTIEPGAVVYFASDYRSGIVVNGSLMANGSVGASIFLGTEAAHKAIQAGDADEPPSWPPHYWKGLEFRNTSAPSVINNVVIARALVGSRVFDSILEVTDTEFRACGRGLEIGGTYSSTTIRNSRFVRNSFGVDIWSGASIEVSGSQFERNRIAINNPLPSLANPVLSGNTYTDNSKDLVTGPFGALTSQLSAPLAAATRPLAGGVRPAAGVSVNSDITVNTNWTLDQSPVAVTGQVRIASGATLTIDPGVVVQFSLGASSGLIVNGTLVAQGTPASPIWFTSALDTETVWHGLPILPPSTTGTARVADWNGIQFNTPTAGSAMVNTIVRYSSSGIVVSGPSGYASPSLTGNILADNATGIEFSLPGGSVTLSGHTFVRNGIGLQVTAGTVTANSSAFDSNTTGAMLSGGTGNISGNSFTNNTTAIQANAGVTGSITGNTITTAAGGTALRIDPSYLGTVSGNTTTGGGMNAIFVAGGTHVTGTSTWNQVGIPYFVDYYGVSIDSGASLTISPGVVVKFQKGAVCCWTQTAYLRVNGGGSLTANGTAQQPITFTSYLDDAAGGDTNGDGAGSTPAQGDWSGIRFEPSSMGAVSYAVIRYGGGNAGNGPGYAALDIGTGAAQPTLGAGIQITDNNTGLSVSGGGTNVTFAGATVARNGTGILINSGASASVSGSTFINNATGVNAASGSLGSVTGNTFTAGSGQTAISLGGNVSTSGNTITGGGFNEIDVPNGTQVTGNVTWGQLGLPYVVDNDGVQVNSGATLTIAPGVIVKFRTPGYYRPASYMRVNGSLVANGTAALPIIFTSYLDDVAGGDTNGDGAASTPGSGNWAGIRFEAGSTGSISNAVIRYGGGGGTYGWPNFNAALDILTGAANQPALGAGLQITDNNTGIAVSGTDTDETISGLTLARNSTGVRVDSGKATINGNTLTGNTTAILVAGGTGVVAGNTITGSTTGIQASAGAAGSITGNTITTAANQTALSINGGYLGTVSGNTATGGGFNEIDVPNGTQVTGNVTWGQLGLPYVVDNDGVQVNSGATLTIAPGVIVKFRTPGYYRPASYMRVNGSLVANGTAALPIIFTSYLDDVAGGDTNGDGAASTPGSGNWAGIRFEAGSTGSISNAVIRYGGGGGTYGWPNFNAALDILTGAANQPALGAGLQITDNNTGIAVSGTDTDETISGLTLARNSTGVRVDSGKATINGNTLTGNTTAILVAGGTGVVAGNTITGSTTGIQASAGAAGSITGNTITTAANQTALSINGGYLGTVSGNTATGGGFNEIDVPNGTQVTGNVTWGQLGLPYVVDNDGVQVNSGATLTIAPGVIVKFRTPGYYRPASYMRVNGSLVANGTAALPIIFTSYLDDVAGGDTNGDGAASTPGSGNWAGIRFEAGSTGSISNAVIRYGGGGGTYGWPNFNAALDILTGAANQPALGAGLQITDNNTGIAVSGTDTDETISGLTLARNGTGVRVDSGKATINGNTLTGNTTGVFVNGGTGVVTGNTITGSTTGIQANAGTGGSITGNTITTATGGTALNISAGYSGTVSGNTASGGGFNAIYVPAWTHVTGAVTWGQLGIPYFVDLGGVHVDSGATLTIAPGVVVKFQQPSGYNYSSYVRVYGTLVANGTATQPITFTSYRDDTALGDTNGDGSATTPAAGDWAGIRFEAGSTGSISNAVIRYGGGGAYYGPSFAALDIGTEAANQPALGAGLQITDNNTGIAVSGTDTDETISGLTLARNGTGVRVDSGKATINGNTLTGNTTGVFVNGGTGVVTGNTITGSTTGIQANAGTGGSITGNTITTATGGTALNISAGYSGTVSGNTASGGGFNAIYVPAWTHVTGAVTWGQLGIPYFVDLGGVHVDSGATLTIAPGVVVKFQQPSGYNYSSYVRVYGTLVANGTATQPITFTSYRDDTALGDTNGDGSATTPAAGDWAGIRFEAGSTGSISNAVIRYGGGGAYYGPSFAALDIGTEAANQPALGAGLQITDNNTGIAVSGTDTDETISGLTLARNGTGVRVDSGKATINGNTLTGNTTGVFVNGGTGVVTGNTITGSTTGIQANAGTGGSITGNTITTATGGTALNISAGYLGTVNGNTATGGGTNAIFVGGILSGSVTWGQLGIPYVIGNGGVTIASGSTLTIMPGVVVKLTPSGFYDSATAYLKVQGTLVANGTATQPITFTSYLDDTVLGDTNGDGNGSAPSAGNWAGIYFDAGSNGSLTYSVIRYGGRMPSGYAWPNWSVALTIATGAAAPTLNNNQITDNTTGIEVTGSGTNIAITHHMFARNGTGLLIDSGEATISDDTFNNNGTGIAVNSGAGNITGNTFTGNTGTGISAGSGAAGTITGNTITTATGGTALNISAGYLGTVNGNTATGGGTNAVFVGGTLSGSVTWGQLGIPYVIGNGGVTIASGSTLTIMPGVAVKLTPSGFYDSATAYLKVQGTLVANGTATQPITFTSYLDDTVLGDTNGDGNGSAPSAGNWAGIYFDAGSNGSLTYSVIRYGGRMPSGYAWPNWSVALTIATGAAAPTLNNNQITDNTIGIEVTGSGTNVTIGTSNFTRNGTAIHASSHAAPTITGNDIVGNSFGVQNDDSSVTINATNNYWGAATGPSGAGSGTGDPVSTYVNYLPFLSYSALNPPAGTAAISYPASVAFSEVPINTTVRRTITIASTGTAPLIISAITISGVGFAIPSLPSLPLTVAPNASASFDVTLAPAGTITYSGSVSIASNAAGSARVIYLSGIGVPPPLPPPGTITLVSSRAVAARGQSVTLSGSVTDQTGKPISNLQVLLQIILQGVARTQSVYTTAQGTYQSIFQPNPTDAGTFSVQATVAAGGQSRSATATFRVLGLFLEAPAASQGQVMGTAQQWVYNVRNLGDTTISGVSASVSGPAPFTVTASTLPSSLPPGSATALTLTITAPSGTPPTQPVNFSVTVTGMDQASGVNDTESGVLGLAFHPAISAPVVSPPSAAIGVNPGKSASQVFTVTNNGFVSMSNAAVTLQDPTTFSWITLGDATLGTVAPGQTKSVQVIANPPASLATGQYSVILNVSGGPSALQATLVVNVTAAVLGAASFQVSDDAGQKVGAATVTLVNQSGTSSQGVTDSNGNVAFSSLAPGQYTWTATASVHDPASGTLTVLPGASTSVVAVKLSLNVVNLVFTVVPTTISDVYNIAVTVVYTTTYPKPALQLLPTDITLSNQPQKPYTGKITVTNTHPTAPVTGVVIDASNLDAAIDPALRLKFQFQDGSTLVNAGNLPPGGSYSVSFTASPSANFMQSRDVGSILVTGNYIYTDNGVLANGQTKNSIPVRYNQPGELDCDVIHITNDERDPNQIKPLAYDSASFVHSCTSLRPIPFQLFKQVDLPMLGFNLVAFYDTQGGKNSAELVNNNAINAFWWTNFNPAKTSLIGNGDSASYDVSAYSTAGLSLLDLLTGLRATNHDVFTSRPFYVALRGQWDDRSTPNTYLIPIQITTLLPTKIQQGCTGSCGGTGPSGGGGGGGSSPPVVLPTQGTMTILFDQTLRLERQAFNATLGVLPNATITNASVYLTILDANGANAAANFYVVNTGDTNGLMRGGATLAGSALVQWQLIPNAGAGGTTPSGRAYYVQASMAFTFNGKATVSTSQVVPIIVRPSPHLKITYSLPRVIMEGKPAKMRIKIDNIGYGNANGVTISSAQPSIVSNPQRLPISFDIAGDSNTYDGSTYQSGTTLIQFGQIPAGGSAQGYWSVQTSQRGYFIDISSKITHQDYLGTTLDSLVDPPVVTFTGAIGAAAGWCLNKPCPPSPILPGSYLDVALLQGTSVVATDVTSSTGVLYFQDLPVGHYTIEVCGAVSEPLLGGDPAPIGNPCVSKPNKAIMQVKDADVLSNIPTDIFTIVLGDYAVGTPAGAVLNGGILANRPTVVLVHGISDNANLADSGTSQWSGTGVHGAATLLQNYLGGSANVVQVVWPGAYTVTTSPPLFSQYKQARGEAIDAANDLARQLFVQLGPAYNKPIHFIAHSLGTAVSAYTIPMLAKLLPLVPTIQFTSLERPQYTQKLPEVWPFGYVTSPASRYAFGYDNTFFPDQLQDVATSGGPSLIVDNYFVQPNTNETLDNPHISWTGAGDLTDPIPGATVYNHPYLVHPAAWNGLLNEGVKNDHNGVEQWYRFTISPNMVTPYQPCISTPFPPAQLGSGFDPSLDPCQKGWQWSVLGPAAGQFPTVAPNVAPKATIPLSMSNQNAGLGCDFPTGQVRCVETTADSMATASIDIPAGGSYISFEYAFQVLGDGDYAEVSLSSKDSGGNVTRRESIWKVKGISTPGGIYLSSGSLPTLGFSGTTTIEFRLHPVGGINAVVTFRNITTRPTAASKQTTTTTLVSSANPSVLGHAITLTATVAPGSGGGTVSFMDGANQLGSPVAINGSGVATLTTSALSRQTHSITAVYSGGGNYLGSTSAVLSQVVDGAPTATQVTASVNPSTFGQAVTLTATVSGTGGTPTGSVDFYDGSTKIGTGALVVGVATLAVSNLAVGTRSITANYTGDATFASSTSNTLSQVVNLAATTVSVTASPNPSTLGQNVTFTASVSGAAGGTPTGRITFKDGVVVLGQGTLSGGTTSFATASLTVGTRSITALYAGDGQFSSSTSSALSQTVQKGGPSVVVTSSPNPSVTGQIVAFHAAVSGTGDTPTGGVTIMDGASSLGTITLNSGAGDLSVALNGTGSSHSITGQYGGNASFNSATSTAISQTVNAAATIVTLTPSANPSLAGNQVTFTATVSVTAPGQGTPLGSVTFLDGSTAMGTAQLSGASASFSTSSLAVGTHSITASYAGSAAFAPSISVAVPQVVSTTGTATTLTSAPNPANLGGNVTLTANVTSSSGTAPQGTVAFLASGVTLGSAAVSGSGVATFNTSSLAAGPSSLTATYTSSNGLSSSTSGAVAQVVLVPITVTPSPAAAQVAVDGVTFTGSRVFNWVVGSTHALSAPTPQSGSSQTDRIAWDSWSNGASQANQSIVVPAAPTTYTAVFATQYLVSVNLNPTLGGSVSGAGWYKSGAAATLTATAASGYRFTSWSFGTSTSTANPVTVTVNAAMTVGTNFTALSPALAVTVGTRSDGTAAGTRNVALTLTNNGAGAAFNAQIAAITTVTTTTGTGTVTLASGVPGPNPGVVLAPSGATTVPIVLNWPTTATRVSITFRLTATDSSGTVSYPVTQTVSTFR